MITLEQLLQKHIPKKPIPVPIQKKQETEEFISDDLTFLTTEKEVTKDEPISYIADKYAVPRDSIFINLHVPFLLNPYDFQVDIYRAYKQWILHPNQFVLNTFARSRFDSLRNYILNHFYPNSTMDIHHLFMMLSEFELTVPAQFENSFIEILKNRGA